VFLGHIYLGTIGTRGALRCATAMSTKPGQEHHALWADDVRAGKIPAKRSSSPPPAGMQAAKEGA
jgi:formate dehydrogenase subunit gamma